MGVGTPTLSPMLPAARRGAGSGAARQTNGAGNEASEATGHYPAFWLGRWDVSTVRVVVTRQAGAALESPAITPTERGRRPATKTAKDRHRRTQAPGTKARHWQACPGLSDAPGYAGTGIEESRPTQPCGAPPNPDRAASAPPPDTVRRARGKRRQIDIPPHSPPSRHRGPNGAQPQHPADLVRKAFSI